MPRIQSVYETNEPTIEPNMEVLKALTVNAPKFDSVSEALDHHDAGLNDIAQTIAYVMKYGSSDGVRLNAAKLALEAKGVSKGNNSNTINFIISDSQGVNLMGVFNPQR